jgi:hypothetical protein
MRGMKPYMMNTSAMRLNEREDDWAAAFNSGDFCFHLKARKNAHLRAASVSPASMHKRKQP